MAMSKLKKGDNVIVIAGKDKGKSGSILKVMPKERKVVVSQVNLLKKHVKPNKLNPQGGIVEKEYPVDISNVAYLDPKTGKPTRVGIKFLADGKKARFAKASGEIIEG